MSRPCPVCEGVQTHVVHIGDGIQRCEGCGAMARAEPFSELHLSPEQRSALPGYADLVRRRPTLVAIQRRRALRLQRELRLPPGARLLDVGAATGTLGSALEGALRYTGLEPDPALRAHAPPELEILGEELDRAEFPAGSFEVIALCEVLEHLPHPVRSLRRAARWLAPGGALWVEAPDEERLSLRSTLRRALGATAGQVTHPAHTVLFTRSTLATALDRAGFQDISVRRSSTWDDPRRLGMVIPGPAALHRAAAGVVRLSGLDHRLGLGTLVATARVEG